MAILTWPTTLPFKNTGWRLAHNNSIGLSRVGTEEVLQRGRSRWRCRMVLPHMETDTEAPEFFAFLLSLGGVRGSVKMPVHEYVQKRGSGTGSTTLRSTYTGGNLLLTQGWSGANPILRTGDWIGLNQTVGGTPVARAARVTADVNQSLGNADIPIEPAWRFTVSAGVSVNKNPGAIYCVMRLADDDQVDPEHFPGRFSEEMTIEFVEAIRREF